MTAEPLLLAVETATETASVALARGEAWVAEHVCPPELAVAEALLPSIDALLAEQGETLAAVEAFALSIGPGSFTGLRIGLATVKGLAFGSERPVAAVPTLAAVAETAPRSGPVVSLLDARRGEVYAAGFEGGAPAPWLPEGVHPVAGLAEHLPAGCQLVGEGLAVCDASLLEAPDFEAHPETRGLALAGAVARLGAGVLAAAGGVAAAQLVPRYVRRAQAEVLRTGERYEAPAPGTPGEA